MPTSNCFKTPIVRNFTSINRSAAYGYNGTGARVQKTVNGIATLFAYDEAGHLIGEYSGTGSPIQETIYLGDLPVSMLRAAKLYAVHADYRNAPRQLDDATGTAVWTWTPLPFGESAAIANPIPYNLRYPGQYFDSESGLFYNGFRDYDPVAGQYIESDPIGLGGGVNTYAFTESNPINGTDPLGLTIFYANHPVAGDIYHSKIVIIPDEQAAYVNDPRFKVNEQGQYSATIGAGPEGFPWRLIAGVDRKRDVSQPCDNATPLHLPPVYRDENDAIKNLFDLANDYNRNPELYGLFPTNKGSYYNSNSFVSGLLNAAGFDPPMNTGAYTPGYNKPVPGYRY